MHTNRSEAALPSNAPLIPRHARVDETMTCWPGAFGLPIGPLLAGFDCIAQGVALLDNESRLVYINASARVVLARAGWSIEQSRCRGRTDGEQRVWLSALDAACQRDQRQLVELVVDGDSHFAVVIPLSIGGRIWAFVTFGREELCGALELQMFASRHGLTYAEGEVLRRLAGGLRAAEIAQAHGVATSTVLTQIASLRSKTLASSVRELLGTLARLPALRAVRTCVLADPGDRRPALVQLE